MLLLGCLPELKHCYKYHVLLFYFTATLFLLTQSLDRFCSYKFFLVCMKSTCPVFYHIFVSFIASDYKLYIVVIICYNSLILPNLVIILILCCYSIVKQLCFDDASPNENCRDSVAIQVFYGNGNEG